MGSKEPKLKGFRLGAGKTPQLKPFRLRKKPKKLPKFFRQIGGELFRDTGYEGKAAVKKQKYWQEQGSKTRLIRRGGRKVLFIRSGRQRKKL